MMALADQEKVEVTEADLEKHLTEMAQGAATRASLASRPSYSAKIQGLQQLRGQLRLEMALDVLESKAVVTQETEPETKPETKPDTESAPAADAGPAAP